MLVRVIISILLLCSNTAFANNCEEQEIRCTEPAETRRIEGKDIERECWKYKYKLNCHRSSKNDCNKINSKDCSFVSEECIKKVTEGSLEFCANYKRHYACSKQVEYEEEKIELLKNDNPIDARDLMCNVMCLDGECSSVKKAAAEDNNELKEAIGMLNILRDSKGSTVNDKLISILKGTVNQCDKKILDYLNCCSMAGGWGQIFGASCGAEQKNLHKSRQEKKCVEVGSYCHTEFPVFGCVIRRTTFCCYDSVISKIINQEAKKQLNIGNGTPEHPNCGGISLEDLEKVDLSKADFKEFYDEVVIPNIKIPDLKTITNHNAINAEKIIKNNSGKEKNGFNPDVLKGGL